MSDSKNGIIALIAVASLFGIKAVEGELAKLRMENKVLRCENASLTSELRRLGMSHISEKDYKKLIGTTYYP